MKAVRYYGPGDVRVEQVPEPEAAKGQVKIKIAWNGICGSDVHAYLTKIPKIPELDVPNKITGETLPIGMGHEFSGTIVSIGQGVDTAKFSVGQNVVVEPLISCMETDHCRACASGSRNICADANFIGVGGWGGGLAQYIAVNQEFVHILPKGISLEAGAIVEPLAVAWHAVKRSNFKEGNTALILGAGPIGLLVVKILIALKASTIVVSEPAADRRNLAVKLGATRAVDPLSTDIISAVSDATANSGVDVAYDVAGIQASLDAAIMCVKPRGTIMNVALWEENPRLQANLILLKEINYTGIIGYDRVHPEVLEALASGKLTGLEELITSKVALEDVVEKGFKALLKEKDTQIKILLHP